MDHMPIISILEIGPERVAYISKPNFKLMDWVEFWKSLSENLEEMEEADEITSEVQFHARIALVDEAIKLAIQKHVLLTKLSPYTKR